MGIEPTAPAWEAGVLPLYDARNSVKPLQFGKFQKQVQAVNEKKAGKSRPEREFACLCITAISAKQRFRLKLSLQVIRQAQQFDLAQLLLQPMRMIVFGVVQ